MQVFTSVTGVAAPFLRANVDTDVIMPKQFLKGITREDLARGLFYDLRFDASGAERADFVLNQPGYRGASILVVGPNFGCGSSREHAVWGLEQSGIRAIVGTQFASIFSDNCAANGLLLVSLAPTEIERVAAACADPKSNTLTVDLLAERIGLADGTSVPFAIEPRLRAQLLTGQDAIATTLAARADIEAFERRHFERAPWLRPPTPRP